MCFTSENGCNNLINDTEKIIHYLRYDALRRTTEKYFLYLLRVIYF